MNPNQNRPYFSSSRRRLISNGVKIALLSAIITPLTESCTNKTKKSGNNHHDSTGSKKGDKTSRSKKKRQKWSHESLVVNSRSGVMHLPSSKVYHYYDEIKSSHVKDVAMGAWAAALTENVRINKQQSGNILEILALQQLKTGGMTEQSLTAATDILARAFSEQANSKNGRNLNETNFRLHELMLQLIAMNNSVPMGYKYQTFLSKVKKPDNLRKRQTWMATEAMFNDRVNYILQHDKDYLERLQTRADRYSFT